MDLEHAVVQRDERRSSTAHVRSSPNEAARLVKVGSADDVQSPKYSKLSLLVFCAGPALERARPLLGGLRRSRVSVEIRTDEDLMRMPLDEEVPVCDAVLVFWSQYFRGTLETRLSELCERIGASGAQVLNDVNSLVEMQDRNWLLQKVRESQVPTPDFAECSREGEASPTLEEHEDYIVIGEKRVSKPFVEKPLDRRDRDIFVYYPKDAGGGRALLSTRESGDVQYTCRFEQVSKVRREGSFIYQEYFQHEGFLVQAVCVGNLVFGNAVPSGMFTRRSDSNAGTPEACPVLLRQEEKLIAAKLHHVFKQTLFGITFVRSQTGSSKSLDGADHTSVSYVIDVWPGIPHSGLGVHTDDVTRAVINEMTRHRLQLGGWLRNRSRSLPMQPMCSDGAEAEDGEPCTRVASGSASGNSDGGDDLLCVLLVARHSERTPKQKVKIKVKLQSEFFSGWLVGWLVGPGVGASVAVAPPDTLELRSPEQLTRLASAARRLAESGHKVGTLADALGHITAEGLLCHAKVSVSGATFAVTLKWGGELTQAGADDAEHLGTNFRSEMFPNEDIDELHATLRHDVKVYSSRERRCQQTAAAFCKGMMKLNSPLPPIIAALVRTDDSDFGRLRSSSSAAKAEEEPSAELPPVRTPWEELERQMGGFQVPPLLRDFGSPLPALQALRSLLEELAENINKEEPRQLLYGGETPLLLRERYKDALSDFGTKEDLKFDKVEHVLDHLEYDMGHNLEAMPESARELFLSARPLCEALCDAVSALQAVEERERTPQAGAHGLGVLHKLRWDLRVASGADLGNEQAHLLRHEAMYKAVAAGRQKPCVRTRLYFSHNSQLQGLLGLLSSSKSEFSAGFCGARLDEEEWLQLLRKRLGFLSHFAVTLHRRGPDGALVVSCDFASAGGEARERLFEMPLEEADSWWSQVLADAGTAQEAASPD